MYIYIYIYIYVFYLYLYIYIRIYIIYVYTYLYRVNPRQVRVSMQYVEIYNEVVKDLLWVYTCIYMYIYICVHICIYMHICICDIYIYICVYVIYIYLYIYTYICRYIHLFICIGLYAPLSGARLYAVRRDLQRGGQGPARPGAKADQPGRTRGPAQGNLRCGRGHARGQDARSGAYLHAWPIQDIVVTNIVWCIAYKREVGRESYTT